MWFPSNLRHQREEKGLKQSDVVKRMQTLAGLEKYNQSALSRTEEGTRIARLDEAVGLAYVLNCEVTDLLRRPKEFMPVVALRNTSNRLWEALMVAAGALRDFHEVRHALEGFVSDFQDSESARVQAELNLVRGELAEYTEDFVVSAGRRGSDWPAKRSADGNGVDQASS